MNRKIILSAMSIMSAFTLVAGSAFAAFTTTATAAGNTFSSTNPALNITIGANTGTNISGFSENGLVPGAAPVPHTFTLTNTDNDTNASMALTSQFTVTLGSGSYLDNLSVNISCDNGANVTKSVNQWAASAWGLGTLAPGASTICTMSASLPSGDTTDDNQSVKFDAIFGASVGN